MSRQWLLLLLVIEDLAFGLSDPRSPEPGGHPVIKSKFFMTLRGTWKHQAELDSSLASENSTVHMSDATNSAGDATTNRSKSSPAVTAPPNKGTISVSAVMLKSPVSTMEAAMPGAQKLMPPAPPNPPIACVSDEFTEQASPKYKATEKTSDAAITTTTQGPLESRTYTLPQRPVVVTVSTTLNKSAKVTSLESVTTTVSEKSARTESTISSKTMNTVESLPVRTSTAIYTPSPTLTPGTVDLNANMPETQKGEATDTPPTSATPTTTPANAVETLSITANTANWITSPILSPLGTTDLKTTMSGTPEGTPATTPASPTPPNQTTTPTITASLPTTRATDGSTSLTQTTLDATDLKNTVSDTQKGNTMTIAPDSARATTITSTQATVTSPITTGEVDHTTSRTSMSGTWEEEKAVATPLTSTSPPNPTTVPSRITDSLPTTASMAYSSTSLTPNAPGTTDLDSTMPGTQKGDTTAMPPTAPSVSTVSEAHGGLTAQSPLPPGVIVPSTGTTPAQPPQTTAAQPTALLSSSSQSAMSSAMTVTTPASEDTQSSSPRAGLCALDEYPDTMGVCMCNDSYYAHSELSRMLVSLHCQPQNLKVALRSCFLKTHHWIMRGHALSGCSAESRIEEGHRMQTFLVDKKNGVCGLQLSTNSSHALYSLEVHLVQVLPHSVIGDATRFNFSCAYPLAVDVSQTHPYPVVSQTIPFPYSTIHVPGVGDTIVILGIFTDLQKTSALENKPIPLGTSLYVVLRVTNSDAERFTLVVNEVFASTTASKMGSAEGTYHFVKESCPLSNRLIGDLSNNGLSLEVTLAFNLIHFLSSDTVYLHGRVTLCDKLARSECQPTCNQQSPAGNKARSVVPGRRGGQGNASGWIVFGPIQISESSASNIKSSAGVWVAGFLVMMIGWMLE